MTDETTMTREECEAVLDYTQGNLTSHDRLQLHLAEWNAADDWTWSSPLPEDLISEYHDLARALRSALGMLDRLAGEKFSERNHAALQARAEAAEALAATLQARCEALRGHADALCDDVCANWCVDPKKCKMDAVSPGCAYRAFIDDTTTDTGEGA